MNRKADFFTKRIDSIRITNRIESIRIANWNALLVIGLPLACKPRNQVIIVNAATLATSEAELQELVDRLDRVSGNYSLLINVDETKVMASEGIACRLSFRMNYWSRWRRYVPVPCVPDYIRW